MNDNPPPAIQNDPGSLGPKEKAIYSAAMHAPAVLVVTVSSEGTVNFGYQIGDGAHEDAAVRLLCGAQTALQTLTEALAKRDGSVH